MESNLISRTLEAAEQTLAQYRHPALALSFGKDSLVLLSLLSHLRLPVICHRPAFQPERWQFANRMIEKLGLTVYDWPPVWTAMQEKDGNLELVSAYNTGDNEEVFSIGQKIINNPGMPHSKLVCGLHDCIKRPRSRVEHVWDCLVIGHKHGDPNHLGGSVEIQSDIKGGLNCDIYMPLRHWTEENVHDYLNHIGLEADWNRYIATVSTLGYQLREIEDKTRNPDYVEGCFACINRAGEKVVKCPRLFGKEVENISSRITYIEPRTTI